MGRRTMLTLAVIAFAATMPAGPSSARLDYPDWGISIASVNSAEEPGISGSATPAVSGDGRYVAFLGGSNNLPDPPGEWSDDEYWGNIYVRDRVSGTTELVSSNLDGEPTTYSVNPAMSADGRTVVFESNAYNLVPDDIDTSTRSFIFMRDLDRDVTSVVSRNTAGEPVAGYEPDLSSDGRFVVFLGSTGPGLNTILRRDIRTGTTEVVLPGVDDPWCGSPSVSGRGRFVAFQCSAPLTQEDTNDLADVYVRDMRTGQLRLVSTAYTGGAGNAASGAPDISGDGRHVAFESAANNLVERDRGRFGDIFVAHLRPDTIRKVSIGRDGTHARAWSGGPSISTHGRFVAFTSLWDFRGEKATDYEHVYRHDRVRAAIRLLSANPETGKPGNAESRDVAMSDHGRHVAFQSFARNLVVIGEDGDVPHPHVLVWDRDVRIPPT